MDNTEMPPSPEAALAEACARAEALEQRLIRAELKAEAVRAGMLDMDGLKLFDLGAAKLAENGEVEGAVALMARMKQEKPWLFATASSSANSVPPPASTPTAKLATQMSDEEYRTARTALLRNR